MKVVRIRQLHFVPVRTKRVHLFNIVPLPEIYKRPLDLHIAWLLALEVDVNTVHAGSQQHLGIVSCWAGDSAGQATLLRFALLVH